MRQNEIISFMEERGFGVEYAEDKIICFKSDKVGIIDKDEIQEFENSTIKRMDNKQLKKHILETHGFYLV